MKVLVENSAFPYKNVLSAASFKTSGYGVQSRLIKKNRVLAVTTLFFWEFYFSLRISYKTWVWFTNHPNVRIPSFRKRCSFIWGCFFHVSIPSKYTTINTRALLLEFMMKMDERSPELLWNHKHSLLLFKNTKVIRSNAIVLKQFYCLCQLFF